MSEFVLIIVLRVSLLLAVAALVIAAMRRSSAAARHLVWTCALAGSLMVPVVSVIVPAWELPVLPAIQARTSGLLNESASDTVIAPPLPEPRPPVAGRTTQAERTMIPPDRVTPIVARLAAWPLLVWLLGVMVVVARLALGTARMQWIARRATRVASGRWMRLAERLAAALGVGRRVVFLEGNQVAMPMTWGVVTSRVLLPRSAESWPLARQRVVLLHELAHVKRRDCLTQLLAQLACAVYWFNPLVWFASARLRAEREHACDDLVLASGTRGSEYADHLLDIARSMRSTMAPTWGAVAMAHRSQLEGRLMAILDPQVPRRFPTRRRSIALVACMMGLVLPVALMTPAPRAAEAVSPASLDQSPTQPIPSPAPEPAPQRAPVAQAQPVPVPGLTGIVREAVTDAIPDATKDLVREGIITPGLGFAIGQAVAQGVSSGVSGGVKGGVTQGVQGGVRVQGEQEIEKEVEVDRKAPRDPRVVAALVGALKDSDKDVRESAMQALANMRAPEALEAIRGSLKDENPSVRQQAAFALGQYRDRTSVDALAGMLQDSSGDVREQAVFALGQIRDPRSVAPLVGALKDPDADVREQAAFALGQLRSAEAVDPLGALLRDKSADVREQAAFALGQIRDRRAVDSLLTALKDEAASVREQAAFALGQLRDPRAIDGLTAALKDPNADVRQHAAFALGQLR